MKKPSLLLESEKYNLTNLDFDLKLHQYIFYAISSMAYDGAEKVEVQDIDIFLKDTVGGAVFQNKNGIQLLNDSMQLANETAFNSYYNLLKKENLLRDLKKSGIDTSEFYDENPITHEQIQISEKYLELEIKDMLEIVKRKVLKIEGDYLKNDSSETISAFDGIEELVEELKESPDIGLPLQGDIFNTIAGGARKGTFFVRSASSGTGKTRMAVADACHLAFPIKYDYMKYKWVPTGQNEKVLIIVTEQTMREVQTMILAYLTGMNETKIKRPNTMTPDEEVILKQAIKVLYEYKDNLYIVRMPNPSIQVIKTVVRENVMLHDIEYVFYDYIFISPSLLSEFKGIQLRNDEVLLMMSTALKDLAVELDIFVMTSTQTNAQNDNNTNIKNESGIAGSRSIINKADFGCVMTRISPEEYKEIETLIEQSGIVEPNVVMDIYKNRGGEWTQVRVWSYFDTGTMVKKDLFITDGRFQPILDFSIDRYAHEVPLENYAELLTELNGR